MKPGFYWVRVRARGKVEIAELSIGGSWYLAGVDMFYDITELEVLSERLVPPA